MKLALYTCCSLFSSFLLAEEAPPSEASLKSHGYIPLANLESEPSSFVDGVNVITGDWCDSARDLVIASKHPLTLERSKDYSPFEGSLGGGWNWNLEESLTYRDREKKKNLYRFQMHLNGSLGAHLDFEAWDPVKEAKYFTFITQDYPEGVTNCPQGYIDGRDNLKNLTVEWHLNFPHGCSLKMGNGVIKLYKDLLASKIKAGKSFVLQSLTYPDGTWREYIYDQEGRISNIQMKSGFGNVVSSMTVLYPVDFKKSPSIRVQASDGREVDYTFQKYKVEVEEPNENPLLPPLKKKKSFYALANIKSSDAPWRGYQHIMDDKRLRGKISKKYALDGRYTDIQYYPHCGKVKMLLEPLGKDGSPIPKHQFTYKGDQTIVLDAMGHKTVFTHAHKRLSSVERYRDNNIDLHTRERLFWGDPESAFASDLMARSIENGQGKTLVAKSYAYDAYHNVIEEKTWGNMTGTTPVDITMKEDGTVEAHSGDCLVKKSSYSTDGKNLLLSSSDPDGENVWTYCDKTSQVKSHLFRGRTGERIRRFYQYDKAGSLRLEVVDDGLNNEMEDLAGVTERKVKTYQMNGRGQPEVIEESLKTFLSYNVFGQLIHTECFDYVQEWDYDERGHVTRELRKDQSTVFKEYDVNGNVTRVDDPQKGLSTHFFYDFSNRLIRQVDNYVNRTLVTHFSYDVLGRLVSKVDPQGCKEEYVYNSHHQLIETIGSFILTENGVWERPHVKKEYNERGQIELQIDGKGHETRYAYTSLGLPCRIDYPDGTFETLEYNLSGKLIKKRERTGCFHCYDLDSLGRVLVDTLFTDQGECTGQSVYTYSAFHLLSETDPSGLTTRYSYDPWGRLSKETKGEFETCYEYDALGRITKKQEQNLRATFFRYDLSDRVVEEHEEDNNGNLTRHIQKEYNALGQLTCLRIMTDQGPLEELWEYDSLGKVILHSDAAGHVTRSVWRYDDFDEKGQCIPTCTVIDPKGFKTKTSFDAMGRAVLVESFTPFHDLLKAVSTTYDLNGRRVKLREESGGKAIEAIWRYNGMNDLIWQAEAYGTKEEKKVGYRYNQHGLKEAWVKPDGVFVLYQYDSLGRIVRVNSTDRTVDYAFSYDCVGLVTAIKDQIKQTVTYRQYNREHQLIEEVLGNGLKMGYAYDALNRLMSLVFPDRTAVSYEYESNHLKHVIRKNERGIELWRHTYTKFDLSGKVLEMTLPNSALVEFKYDSLLRLQLLFSKYWIEDLTNGYDATGNLLRYKTIDTYGTQNFEFTYDSLYQLESEEGIFSKTYRSDGFYNPLEIAGRACFYNALHQDTSLKYDLNGNLVSNGEEEYHYDALDRLIKYKRPDMTIEYVYDAYGRRIADSNTTYLYQGDQEIGTAKELRILGLNQGAELGAAVACEINSKLYIPLHNHLGHISCLIDPEKDTVEERYDYSAFGLSTRVKPLIPWGYASKRHDPETGLIFFGKRYYDPRLQRFLTPDPIQREGGPHLYAYVLNNPLKYSDLWGLDPIEAGLNALSYCMQQIYSTASQMIRTPGRILEYVGRNWTPVPILRDGLEVVGRCLAGRDINTYIPSFQRNHSCSGMLVGRQAPSSTLYYRVNGMNTTYLDFLADCSRESKLMGDIPVFFTYNGTKGIIYDFMECALQKAGILTKPEKLLKDHIEHLINSSFTPDFNILAVAHSQGGLIMNNLSRTSPASCSQIHVRTLGSASTIAGSPFASVMNYVSTKDPIPLTDPIGFYAGRRGRRPLTLIPSRSDQIVDHCVGSSTYQYALGEIRSDYLRLAQGLQL